MQLVLISLVYLFPPRAVSPLPYPALADKHRPSMWSEVVGLGEDILRKVSVSFTGEGSTGAAGRPEFVLNLRRGDR